MIDGHVAGGQGTFGFNPVLEITSSGFQQQDKRLTLRARHTGIRESVESQRVDRVSEPTIAIDVTVNEVVSSVGVGDVC